MTFQEYVQNLNDLLAERPGIADLLVVKLRDEEDEEDESYYKVRNAALVGHYNDTHHFLDHKTDGCRGFSPNAVCVN